MLEKESINHSKQMSNSPVNSSNEENINIEVPEQPEQSRCKRFIGKLQAVLFKNYLPISLTVAVVFGALVPQPGVFLNHKATQYLCVIGIFLYSGLYLRTSAIKEAIKAYRAMIFGILSILALTCLTGSQLTLLLDFKTKMGFHNVSNINETQSNSSAYSSTYYDGGLGPVEFKLGFIVYWCMPCTISSGLVMVTQLHGNFALALLLTIFTNIVSIFTIPLYLKWMLTAHANVKFDIMSMLLSLTLTLLLPIILGKCLRFVKRIKDFAVVPKHKNVLKIINITLLATITLMKVSKSSQQGGLNNLKFLNIVFIMGWALFIHILFLLMNTIVSFMLRLPLDQKKCIIILASQKTLAVAIPVMSFLPQNLGDQGLMAMTLVITHISIILFDAILIPIWLLYEKRRSSKNLPKAEETLFIN